ncbi:MAG: carboxypeptidase-like regulatory domain-containing protein [Ginsengibacter sp.]
MRKPFLILCTFFLCLTLFGQTGSKVTGEITSMKDGTGIGASVLIKGASKGVSSTASGKYSIDNVPAGAVLIFSAVGYKTMEIPVRGQSVVNASLEVDAQSLDEVIMVAYGTSTRATFTGSATVIGQIRSRMVPMNPLKVHSWVKFPVYK